MQDLSVLLKLKKENYTKTRQRVKLYFNKINFDAYSSSQPPFMIHG